MEIHHTGINVADLDRALSFYRDLLGLEVISKETRKSVIPGRGEITAVFLGDKDGGQVELICEHARGGRKYESGEKAPHVCFIVNDLDSRMEAMRSKGAEVLLQPTTPAYGTDISRIAFIEDPEGFRIEFWEMKK